MGSAEMRLPFRIIYEQVRVRVNNELPIFFASIFLCIPIGIKLFKELGRHEVEARPRIQLSTHPDT